MADMTDTDPTLKSIFERIIRLETEKQELGESIKDIYAEAKSRGYPVDGLKLLVRDEVKTDKQRAARRAAEEAKELLAAKLGILHDLPLGQAAMERATPHIRRVS